MRKTKENKQNGLMINIGLILLISTVVFFEIKLNTPKTEIAHAQEYEVESSVGKIEIPLNDYSYAKKEVELEIPEELESIDVEVTAYDLSVQSCGKTKEDLGYGITASGIDVRGKMWNEARIIAVDPKVIPLGSEVYIEFQEEGYEKYNGTYYAGDTGSAIKGNIIDFFMGDYNSEKANQEVWDFGRTNAKVIIINK